MRSRLRPVVLLLILVPIVGCGGPSAPASPDSHGNAQAPPGPKRIRVAIMGDPPTLSNPINSAGGAGVPGAIEVATLVQSGLVITDDGGQLRPQLAEAVPTVENGLWKVFPDGTMETTWRIREGASWHDGTPFTAEDIVFTARIAQDRDIAIFGQLAYDAVEAVEAVDPRTVTVRWSRPFIEADTMF